MSITKPDSRGPVVLAGELRPLLGLILLALAFALGACGDDGGPPREEVGADGAGQAEESPESTPAESRDSIPVVFSRGEEPATVWRGVPADSVGLEASLERLLAGPTAGERDAGMDSWFSEETSGALASARVDSSGRAVVDFRNLPALIPSASSSAGSQMLLQQLNGTVFSLPEIESVEYRVEGSCARFWEWLQYECRVVERADWTG